MKTIKIEEGIYRVTNGVNSIRVVKIRYNYWIVDHKLNGIFRTKKSAVDKAIDKLS